MRIMEAAQKAEASGLAAKTSALVAKTEGNTSRATRLEGKATELYAQAKALYAEHKKAVEDADYMPLEMPAETLHISNTGKLEDNSTGTSI